KGVSKSSAAISGLSRITFNIIPPTTITASININTKINNIRLNQVFFLDFDAFLCFLFSAASLFLFTLLFSVIYTNHLYGKKKTLYLKGVYCYISHTFI